MNDKACSFGEDYCGAVIELRAENARLREAFKRQDEVIGKFYRMKISYMDSFLQMAKITREVLGDG